MSKIKARQYIEWFQTPDVIVVYPVYMMNSATQTKICTGYRSTVNIPYQRSHPHIKCEMNADDHSLLDTLQFVKKLKERYPELQPMRVMYVDSYYDAVETEFEIDLTDDETMLVSILSIG